MVFLAAGHKLLVVLYELAEGTAKPIKFEDIVVAAFKKYPMDFSLRGYEQYPDAGDKVHRPLYNLRKEGLVNASEKFFSLTPHGIVVAEKLLRLKSEKTPSGRLPRDIENEVSRVMNSPVYQLFVSGKTSEIVDTDFFNYLGVSVRSNRTLFLSRLETMKRVAQYAEKDKRLKTLRELHEFLFKQEKFQEIIKFKSAPERVI